MKGATLRQRDYGGWQSILRGQWELLHGPTPIPPDGWERCYRQMKEAAHEMARLELEDVLEHAWEDS